MYETIIWGNIYPKVKFQHEWDIADFVCKGRRLEKPIEMNDSMFGIISHCWCQDPRERYSIDSVIEKLKDELQHHSK